MRTLLASLALVALSLPSIGCGHAKAVSPAGQTGQAEQPPGRDRDNDRDNGSGESLFDSDDGDILAFGQAAGAGEIRVVANVIRRYYAAAMADDGARACALLYSLFAETLAEGREDDPNPNLKSCAGVVSLTFKKRHAEFAAHAAAPWVLGVRVSGVRGYAVIGSYGRPERYLPIHRDGGAWRIQALLDSGLP
jgi:hypothetical protein